MTSQSTQEKILKAAEKEFLQKGYAATRTTSIADAAGVTHAMLHYYYSSKERLFQKVMESKMKLLSNMLLESIEIADTPLMDRLERVITRHLEFIADNPDLPRFFINEIYSDPERLAGITQAISENADKVLSTLQIQINDASRWGECRWVDARMLIVDILSLNAFPFMAERLIRLICGPGLVHDRKSFIEYRKKETLEIIKRKLEL